jgi:hypothetical protein
MSSFATISMDSKSASNYAYFDALVEFLCNFCLVILAFFAHLDRSQTQMKWLKKE